MLKNLPIILILFSCTTKVVQLKREHKTSPIIEEPIVLCKYGNKIGNLEFQLKSGIVLITSKNKLFQKVNIQATSFDKFELIDWNFDGLKDISILQEEGSGGKVYEVWNYNEDKNQFILNKDISNQFVEIDTLNQRIVFHYREGWQLEIWSFCKYQQNKLVLDYAKKVERWDDQKRNSWIKTTTQKIINGKEVIKADSSIVKS